MIYLKIREIAEEKGISQRQLHLRSGVDINTVRKFFKIPYSTATTETLDKLAKVLGVDASALIESHDDAVALLWLENYKKMEEQKKQAKASKLSSSTKKSK